MKTLIGVLWRHHESLLFVVRQDLRKRYAGSILGLAWLVVYPVLFLAIYAGVYLLIFKVRIPELSSWRYVLFIFSGLVPYLGFSQALQEGSQALVQNPNLVKNTVFPVELIPVKVVLSSTLSYAATLFVLCLFIFAGEGVNQRLWLLPLAFLLQYLFVQGLVWMLSSFSVISKDVGPVLNLALLFLLFISPIAFTPDMVPERLRVFLHVNPLYYLVSIYRASFFEVQPFRPVEFFKLTAIALFFFWGGFVFFRRLEKDFAEYV